MIEIVYREMEEIKTGTFKSLLTASECRCPASHLFISKDLHGLHCLEMPASSSSLLRIKPDSHLPALAVDDSNSPTSWKSGSTSDATLSLTLAEVNNPGAEIDDAGYQVR